MRRYPRQEDGAARYECLSKRHRFGKGFGNPLRRVGVVQRFISFSSNGKGGQVAHLLTHARLQPQIRQSCTA